MAVVKLHDYNDNYANVSVNFVKGDLEEWDTGTAEDSSGRSWAITESDDAFYETKRFNARMTGSKLLNYTDVRNALRSIGFSFLPDTDNAYNFAGVGKPSYSFTYGPGESSNLAPFITASIVNTGTSGDGSLSYYWLSHSEGTGNTGVYREHGYLMNMFVLFIDGEHQYYGSFSGHQYGAGGNGYEFEVWYSTAINNSNFFEYSGEPGEKGYKPTGTKYTTGKPGIGGKGHGATGKHPGYNTDTISNPGAPDESSASAIGSGFIRAYDITKANLDGVAKCLYGSTLATFITGLFYNPLDFIVSLNVFPCQPNIGTAVPVKLGRWQCTTADLGADANGAPLTSQFDTYDFGTINIYENWGSFLDYSHTQIELYLPFIGVVDIDTAEVMNGSISLEYTVDFFTGMCVANVNCNRTVELPDGTTKSQASQHSFQGNCAMNIPLSQVQYGNMIGSLINAGTNGLKGGVAGATLSLVGDVVSGGFKPSVTTKGTISANAGYCSITYPYVRITRPISAESDSYQEVMGYPSYIDSTLGDCDDLCICKSIDLHSISGATDSEIERIRQMCLEGVHV